MPKIEINYSTYESAVRGMEEKNDRTINNNGNIKVEFSGSEMPYLEKYKTAVDKLKQALQDYSGLVTTDTANLRLAERTFRTWDEN